MARFDTLGMFWQDVQQTSRGARGERHYIQPPIPETGWRPPAHFPRLSDAKVLSIDTETKDLELLDNGPGWARGKGHVVGFSIAADGDRGWYFPVRHECEPEMNLSPEHCFAWLKETLSGPQHKVGANLLYDLGWLRHEGIEAKGPLVDVQFAGALLDERAKVGLDAMAHRYCGLQKEGNLLYDWCARYWGGEANDKQRANIYRSPPRLVGPYAEADATLPIRIAEAVYPLLAKEGLLDLFSLECRLIRLLLDMRYQGVAVDLSRAEQLYDRLGKTVDAHMGHLGSLAGFACNPNSNADLARAFDSLGVAYARTAPSTRHPNGQPSFTDASLQNVTHPIAGHIREIRKAEKIRGTFLKSYILDSNIDGKVYGQFHPLRSDDGGTVSGRFSSSTPNLQNIPSRDPELGPLIRGLFIPREGHDTWVKIDYSQMEYRLLVHYALGPGANELRSRYARTPDLDFHTDTLNTIAPIVGWDLSDETRYKLHRTNTKTINFAMIYGMGQGELARRLGLSGAAAKKFFADYHRAVPFAKATAQATSKEAQRVGYVTTLLGRRARFDLWEPAGRGVKGVAMPLAKALATYGDRLIRAYTHKALNRRLQGGNADFIKAAMVAAYEGGIFQATGLPTLTVHDELDFDVLWSPRHEEGFRALVHTMQTVIPVRAPIIAALERGPDWGHVK